MKKYEYHPLCLKFHHSKEVVRALADNMKEHGFNPQYPIGIYQGKILDGRHRYEAAALAGVEPKFTTIKNPKDAELFVVQANMIQRSMSESQKAAYSIEFSKDSDVGFVVARRFGLKVNKSGKSVNGCSLVTRIRQVRKADQKVFDRVKCGELGLVKAGVLTGSRKGRCAKRMLEGKGSHPTWKEMDAKDKKIAVLTSRLEILGDFGPKLESSGPRILIFDIETTPILGHTWGMYEQNVIAVERDWFMLSFAAKWYGEGEVIVKGLRDYPGYKKENDCEKEMLLDLHALLDEADIVVAHNGKKFDVKKFNARLIEHEIDPPSQFQVVDTLTEVRRVASFASNKLQHLADQLDIGEKLKHEGFSMWLGCISGAKESWDTMLAYNKHDVVLLEDLYRRLIAWIRQPSFDMYSPTTDVTRCQTPTCGSTNVREDGFYLGRTRKYPLFKCLDCGGRSRSTKSVKGGSKMVGV